jgi:hypothetical protein
MARPQTSARAGRNANKKDTEKLFPMKDIIIDPEIAGIFRTSDRVLKDNEVEPVVIWKGKNIIVNGRVKYIAARNAGLKKVTAIEKEFANREAAILYTLECQAMRRNLTGAEILTAVQTIKGRKENKDGTGREAELLAKKIDVGPATVYQSMVVLKEADPKDLDAVREGEKSIKKVYTEIKDRQLPVSPIQKSEYLFSDRNVLKNFVSAIIVLLVDSDEKHAAEVIINRLLKSNKRLKSEFYESLPKNVRKQLTSSPKGVR